MKSVLGDVQALDDLKVEDVEEEEGGSELSCFVPNTCAESS